MDNECLVDGQGRRLVEERVLMVQKDQHWRQLAERGEDDQLCVQRGDQQVKCFECWSRWECDGALRCVASSSGTC
jgi:hypothetical protein